MKNHLYRFRLYFFVISCFSMEGYGDSSEDNLEITAGIEEEFFLVDSNGKNTQFDPDPRILESCEENCSPHKIVSEFFRCQIESNSKICHNIADVRNSLRETRRILFESAQRFGSTLLAISTHPFSRWDEQIITPKERYLRFANIFGETVSRLYVCGMHVHLGFGTLDERIRVMTALRDYLPFMLALSCSSPFLDGGDTGLRSFRATMLKMLPRSGMANAFSCKAQYRQLISDYQKIGTMKRSNEIWWDIRPANSFPTIEVRICDTCSRMEDAVSLAALSMSLARWLLRKERMGELPDALRTELINENRWLAQRYGNKAGLIDFSQKKIIPIEKYAEKLVTLLQEDARALNCTEELDHIFTIIDEGNSASRQLAIYRRKISEGATREEALGFVVDAMIEESKEGIDIP